MIGLLLVLQLGILFTEGSATSDEAIQRGAAFLISTQNRDGSFGNAESDRGDVGTTGLAIQALAAASANPDSTRLRAIGLGLRFLESRIQSDGFVYDPDEGLRAFKTAMAVRAFRAANVPRYLSRAKDLEAKVATERQFESGSESQATDAPGQSAAAARLRTALGNEACDPATRQALEFLLTCDEDSIKPQPVSGLATAHVAHGEGYVSYNALSTFVYRELDLNDPDVAAAIRALKERFTLSENPDLTRRFSIRSESPGNQGMYFNYYVLARILSLLPSREFVTNGGERHDWRAELTERIISLQRHDGSWVNDNPRWWENSAHLATSYAVLALRLCEDRRLAIVTESTRASR